MNGQNFIIIRGTGFTKSKSLHLNVHLEETTAAKRNVMVGFFFTVGYLNYNYLSLCMKTIHTFENGQWIEIERWNATAKEKCAKYVH